ncbi:helix-turn-helix transcriptional regulator [Paenibacillus piri]|uniref:AraC family transcriptional regulator n=1 Tax=Paenibacillus piri TaxID=2547395 RepID=A0A4R5K9S5_9BACL|nr:AraC family transcriptional regulator [Paenibacillus piri]TDF89440.1 AraC family transcriptional regulator [Paenibacillus piri]
MDKRHPMSVRWTYPPDKQAGDAAFAPPDCIPELHQFGYQKHAEARKLPLHFHDRAYEFVYVERGTVTWEIAGLSYPTNAGQWFINYPGEPHKARFNHMEPSQIWWLIIEDPENNTSWLRLPPSERDWVIKGLKELPRLIRAVNRVREQLIRLQATLGTANASTSLFARHQLLDVLLGMFHPASTKTIEPDLKAAVTFTVKKMLENPDKRPTVAEMAEAVHLSESHFYKVFHEVYGQSPIAYLERLRMERACDLLLKDMSITDVALELGYKTSQHFTTVFKKQFGCSPSQWRSKLLPP